MKCNNARYHYKNFIPGIRRQVSPDIMAVSRQVYHIFHERRRIEVFVDIPESHFKIGTELLAKRWTKIVFKLGGDYVEKYGHFYNKWNDFFISAPRTFHLALVLIIVIQTRMDIGYL